MFPTLHVQYERELNPRVQLLLAEAGKRATAVPLVFGPFPSEGACLIVGADFGGTIETSYGDWCVYQAS